MSSAADIKNTAGKDLAGADGGGAGLAEAVGDEHRRVAEPRRGERIQAMSPSQWSCASATGTSAEPTAGRAVAILAPGAQAV